MTETPHGPDDLPLSRSVDIDAGRSATVGPAGAEASAAEVGAGLRAQPATGGTGPAGEAGRGAPTGGAGPGPLAAADRAVDVADTDSRTVSRAEADVAIEAADTGNGRAASADELGEDAVGPDPVATEADASTDVLAPGSGSVVQADPGTGVPPG